MLLKFIRVYLRVGFSLFRGYIDIHYFFRLLMILHCLLFMACQQCCCCFYVNQEFNIEKLQLFEGEKKKIRQEYEKKEKQVDIRKKM